MLKHGIQHQTTTLGKSRQQQALSECSNFRLQQHSLPMPEDIMSQICGQVSSCRIGISTVRIVT